MHIESSIQLGGIVLLVLVNCTHAQRDSGVDTTDWRSTSSIVPNASSVHGTFINNLCPAVPAAPKPIDFAHASPASIRTAISERLRDVSGYHVGWGSSTGLFVSLADTLTAIRNAALCLELLQDTNPVVKLLGLYSLAAINAEDNRAILAKYAEDTTKVFYQPGGCLVSEARFGDLVKKMMERPDFLKPPATDSWLRNPAPTASYYDDEDTSGEKQKQESREIRRKFGTHISRMRFHKDSPCYDVWMKEKITEKIDDSTVVEFARQFAIEHDIRRIQGSDLSKGQKMITRDGDRYTIVFGQSYRGIPIYDARITVTIRGNIVGRYVSQVYDDIRIPVKSREEYQRDFSRVFDIFRRHEKLPAGFQPDARFGVFLCILPFVSGETTSCKVCWRCRIIRLSIDYFQIVYIDAETGDVLKRSRAACD